MDRKKLSLLAILAFIVVVAPAQNIRGQATPSCKPENAAWVGTFGYGVSCLDDSGWNTYASGTTPLQSDLIANVAICSDGSTWVANDQGLLKVTGDKTETVDSDFTSITGVACDGKGGVWVAHYQGVSHYADGKWDTTDSSKLGTGDSVTLVKDVAVSADGHVFVVTATSVAIYDGSAWTVYEKGKGFDNDYFLNKIALDGKGNAYVAEDNGLLVFDGKTWKETAADNLSQSEAVAIDANGIIWVGTYSKGLSSYDGKTWTTYDRSNSKLSSNNVRAVAIDGQGRVWAATEYGLDVFDAKDFTVYRMDNSGLLDNEVVALAVNAKGPTLSAVATKKLGSLSGVIVNGKDPVANATIEICTEFLGSSFTGETPCSDNPFTQQVKSNSDGKFTFQSLPVGRYGLAVQGSDGKWVRLTDSLGINSKMEVAEDRDTDIGTVDLGKSS